MKKTTTRSKVQAEPVLTEPAVLKATDPKVFARGEDYFEQGAIIKPTRIGQVLTARCQGSEVRPYQVRVVFGKKKVTEAICTCPYDFGGYCKHLVALLLTHIRAPELIDDKPTVEAVLADRERADLIALIAQMVDYNADLYGLIDGNGLPEDDEEEFDDEW